jgi:predicted RND superfamily exporter protein
VKAGRRFTLISLLVMTVLLVLVFRHPLAVVGPVAAVAATVAWTLGIMGLLGVSMTQQTLILPQLLICISITDAIHIQSVYAKARAYGQDNVSAIRYAMQKNAVPVFLTTATTAAGLLSFLTSGVRPVWELGVFGALGTSIALAITIVILPPLLSFNRKSTFGARAEERKPDLLDRALAGLGGALQNDRARRLVLGSMVLAAVLGVLGLSRLELGLFPLGWFPHNDPMRQTFGAIDSELGGSNELRLLIEPKRGDMGDRQLLAGLEQLEREILAYRDPKLDITLAGESTSILDVVRESWRAFNGGQQSAYAIPPTDAGVRDMLTFLQSGAPDELRHLITLNADRAILNVRVQWVESPRYLVFADHIKHRTEVLVGKHARVTFTGPSYNVAVVGMRLVDGLASSFLLAFLLVGFLIVVQCRSLRLGMIAMVPNALSVGLVLAVFGLLGIPIDAANVTFAAIALSIIDDDAIHLIHSVADARDQGLDLGSAIRSAYAHAGRAMIIASTIVGLGFALRLGEYLRVSRDFGLLMTLSCVMGLVANLVFVPALLRTFGLEPRRAQPVLPASQAA